MKTGVWDGCIRKIVNPRISWRILECFPKEEDLDTERSARAVFQVLKNHVSEGEINDVLVNLPGPIKALWN